MEDDVSFVTFTVSVTRKGEVCFIKVTMESEVSFVTLAVSVTGKGEVCFIKVTTAGEVGFITVTMEGEVCRRSPSLKLLTYILC